MFFIGPDINYELTRQIGSNNVNHGMNKRINRLTMKKLKYLKQSGGNNRTKKRHAINSQQGSGIVDWFRGFPKEKILKMAKSPELINSVKQKFNIQVKLTSNKTGTLDKKHNKDNKVDLITKGIITYLYNIIKYYYKKVDNHEYFTDKKQDKNFKQSEFFKYITSYINTISSSSGSQLPSVIKKWDKTDLKADPESIDITKKISVNNSNNTGILNVINDILIVDKNNKEYNEKSKERRNNYYSSKAQTYLMNEKLQNNIIIIFLTNSCNIKSYTNCNNYYIIKKKNTNMPPAEVLVKDNFYVIISKFNLITKILTSDVKQRKKKIKQILSDKELGINNGKGLHYYINYKKNSQKF